MAQNQSYPNLYQVHWEDFADPVDIVCPSCSDRARVSRAAGRGSCTSCGWSSALTSSHRAGYRDGRDPDLGLPLWFRSNFRGHILWAYNARHLDALRAHVEAGIRHDGAISRSNNRVASRLPRWMTSAKNRTDILAALDRLDER